MRENFLEWYEKETRELFGRSPKECIEKSICVVCCKHVDLSPYRKPKVLSFLQVFKYKAFALCEECQASIIFHNQKLEKKVIENG